MVFGKKLSKKGVMGIGILMIFIATVLVSAIAAGVLIRSTGLLQEKALKVAESATERLVTGVEVFAVYGEGNTVNETVEGLEFLARVRAGSPSLQMRTLGVSIVTENVSLSADLNDSLIGDACTYAALGNLQDSYCFDNRIGDNDTILEEGELIAILYAFNSTYYLSTEEEIEVTFQPKKGALETLEFSVPELIEKVKIRLR